jgi:membrane fusion protein (multidrug efflux system)
MEVDVDISDTSGKTLADAPRSQPLAQTEVFDMLVQAADAEVSRVVQANMGAVAAKPPRPASAAPKAAPKANVKAS